MATVKHLLDQKGHGVWSVQESDSIADAIKEMITRNVGAVIVKNNDTPVGLFTERHFFKTIDTDGSLSLSNPVREHMHKDFVCVIGDHTVNECLAVMMKNKVRYLPVLDDDRQLIGMLSISDLVANLISDQKLTIEQLEHYITG